MSKNFLDIDNCIIIHDVKQIKKEPAETKIKTKNKLAKEILKQKLVDGSKVSIYTKLSRYEKEGFVQTPEEMIEAILKILEVDRNELVKEVVSECYKTGEVCLHRCKAQCRESC